MITLVANIKITLEKSTVLIFLITLVTHLMMLNRTTKTVVIRTFKKVIFIKVKNLKRKILGVLIKKVFIKAKMERLIVQMEYQAVKLKKISNRRLNA